ncbi:unnamed protein product [Rotaria sp. Silwood1]|nr:unnamed protein product [Rotaria sp. Silwood1]
MRRNGVLNPLENLNTSSTASVSATISSSSTTTTRNIPTWTINEKQANNDAYTCVQIHTLKRGFAHHVFMVGE